MKSISKYVQDPISYIYYSMLYKEKQVYFMAVTQKITKFLNKYLFVLGLAAVLLSELPYLILGESSVIPYHDQLDGELIAYIYQAKYLFSGQNIIPEFLCGAAKTALMPPAPLAVLLFKVLTPFAALVTMQVTGQVVAYIGMFRLSEMVTEKKIVSFIAAMLYAFIPFLPVYGLSQYGMPLLLSAVISIYKKQYVKSSMVYVALYAAMSSLVLCGFACLAVWAIALIFVLIRRQFAEQKCLFAGFGIFVGVYVAENLNLFAQMVGIGATGVSHKSAYVLTPVEFFSAFWGYLKYNESHSSDNHLWIVYLAGAVIISVVLFARKWGKNVIRQCTDMMKVLGVIVILCAVAALWDSTACVALRKHLGALGSFQTERVLWMAPMLWILVLAYCLDILWSARTRVRWIVYGVSGALLGCVAVMGLKHALVKPCVQKMINPDYGAISYEDYLAIGVMEQVEALIAERDGVQKDEYRVVSLGIDPAAALYHGFYTVDGYSNNYDLEYKQAFREVMAPELLKSDYIRSYYDDWGNRCYLFSAESCGYYTIEKGGFAFLDLQLDTKALKRLGCDYILSAAYILNPENNNLTLLSEEPLETEDSYYEIFVYKIM